MGEGDFVDGNNNGIDVMRGAGKRGDDVDKDEEVLVVTRVDGMDVDDEIERVVVSAAGADDDPIF